MTEVHAEDDGDPDQRRNARVQQPEERESEEQREDGPEQVHRTTSYAVGERPERGMVASPMVAAIMTPTRPVL